MIIDLIFLLLALAVAAVVIFAWRRVHHEHLEAQAQQAAEEERRAKEVPAREPAAPVPAAVRPPVEWAVPQPAEPPRPMYWPAFLALGLVWLGWGAISSPIFIFAGFAIVVMALTLWIREMLHAN